MLTKFAVRWQYQKGMLAAVEEGVALVPVAKYIIDFPIDTDKGDWQDTTQPMSPAIALPPGRMKQPSLVVFRLQLHYHFAGRLHYHPSSGWDILFDVVALGSDGERLPIFQNESWRATEER